MKYSNITATRLQISLTTPSLYDETRSYIVTQAICSVYKESCWSTLIIFLASYKLLNMRVLPY